MWRVSETADERRGQQSELGAGDPVLAVYYVGGSERRKGEERGGEIARFLQWGITPQTLRCHSLWKWTSDSGVALLGLENMQNF